MIFPLYCLFFLFQALPFSFQQAQIVSLSNSVIDGQGNQYSSLGGEQSSSSRAAGSTPFSPTTWC